MQQPIEPLASPEILPPNIDDIVKNKILIKLKRGDLEDTVDSVLQKKDEYITGKIGKKGNEFVFYDNNTPKYYSYIKTLKNIGPVIPSSKILFPSEPSDIEPSDIKPSDIEPSGGYKRNKSKKSKKSNKSKKSTKYNKNKKSKKYSKK
jgi:hypothetical protein